MFKALVLKVKLPCFPLIKFYVFLKYNLMEPKRMKKKHECYYFIFLSRFFICTFLGFHLLHLCNN